MNARRAKFLRVADRYEIRSLDTLIVFGEENIIQGYARQGSDSSGEEPPPKYDPDSGASDNISTSKSQKYKIVCNDVPLCIFLVYQSYF